MEKELQELGFSEKEASIYLSLLKSGPTTALKLATETDIKRSTVYLILGSLQKKGLVEIESHGWKDLFAAVNPSQFEAMLEGKQRKFSEILPELLGLYKLRGNKQSIKRYEGIDGVKTAYENILREAKMGDPYYAIADQLNWFKLDDKWFEAFLERKSRRTLDSRVILKDSKIAQRYKMMARVWKLELKIVDRPLDLIGDIVVTPQYLLLHNFAPPITAAVIEHPDIIQNYMNIFRFIWGMLPEEKG